MAVKQATVITVTGVKGGVGKTTTTLNLAGVCANKKLKTLIIDMDLYSGGIALSLKVDPEKDLFHITDDMNNNRFDYIENYVTPYHEYIDCITAPVDPRKSNLIGSNYIDLILGRAKMKYDVILIDTNHILSEMNLVVMDASDEILYIMSNDPVDVKNMKTMVAILKDMDRTNYKIILNESSDVEKECFGKADIKSLLKATIDYVIPNSFYQKDVDDYVLDGKIMTMTKGIQAKNKKAMKVFSMIIDACIGKKEETK